MRGKYGQVHQFDEDVNPPLVLVTIPNILVSASNLAIDLSVLGDYDRTRQLGD